MGWDRAVGGEKRALDPESPSPLQHSRPRSCCVTCRLLLSPATLKNAPISKVFCTADIALGFMTQGDCASKKSRMEQRYWELCVRFSLPGPAAPGTPKSACSPLPAEGPGHAGDGAYDSGFHTLEFPGEILKTLMPRLYPGPIKSASLGAGAEAPANFRALRVIPLSSNDGVRYSKQTGWRK